MQLVTIAQLELKILMKIPVLLEHIALTKIIKLLLIALHVQLAIIVLKAQQNPFTNALKVTIALLEQKLLLSSLVLQDITTILPNLLHKTNVLIVQKAIIVKPVQYYLLNVQLELMLQGRTSKQLMMCLLQTLLKDV